MDLRVCSKKKTKRDVTKSVESSDFETSTVNSQVGNGCNEVLNRKRKLKQKPAEVASDVEVDSDGSREARIGYLSSLKASASTDSSHLKVFLAKVYELFWSQPPALMCKLTEYFAIALSQVSFRWVEMFKGAPFSMLIDVPLCYIPEPLYETSVHWIKQRDFDKLSAYVLWASTRILKDLPQQHTSSTSQLEFFVVLAMVLRTRPDTLIRVSYQLRTRPIWQGQDALLVLVWTMAQASQVDLSVGLYSWANNLLPLVGNIKCCSPQSVDLILQSVENILSNPEAETILVNGVVRDGDWLIPPTSFEILVRLTFPLSSERVKTTERFEAIYPLLKKVALAPGCNAMEEIFELSLKLLVVEGNPVLAKEATEIAIWLLTENADCFEQWEILYKENLEASVALLKKLVEEWKDHSLKLISTPSDTLTLNRAMTSFRLESKNAISEGAANPSLYKEADKSCNVILRRLERTTVTTAMLLAAAGATTAATALILSFR
ncbi:predicted protein [Arabidopsis lyrata subsp. lyrata]|uniref:Predicted protein n=1 Tax=Arabidopsis lyrata subsp. lyrata TaxID=81972 RepID=D7L493_ARALL|nr:uncharacterized protein LOC9321684 isoform X1 [Arabidopsis lyrata subsp. lyrata]EFH61877.1 predicted protein [Arabidopsis lyrata subsp. lyrata]|eukprot:XP_002885618.1 uncharacterized protein LOC9321684 isoform X1 [Arabidopsis lyrata subsp. lyrata]